MRQEDHQFKASLGYVARPCLRKEGRKEREGGEREGRKEGGRKDPKKTGKNDVKSKRFQISALLQRCRNYKTKIFASVY
jgi:hypothetical protein